MTFGDSPLGGGAPATPTDWATASLSGRGDLPASGGLFGGGRAVFDSGDKINQQSQPAQSSPFGTPPAASAGNTLTFPSITTTTPSPFPQPTTPQQAAAANELNFPPSTRVNKWNITRLDDFGILTSNGARYLAVSLMYPFRHFSLEELRFGDYARNDKGEIPPAGPEKQPCAAQPRQKGGGLFGEPPQTQSTGLPFASAPASHASGGGGGGGSLFGPSAVAVTTPFGSANSSTAAAALFGASPASSQSLFVVASQSQLLFGGGEAVATPQSQSLLKVRAVPTKSQSESVFGAKETKGQKTQPQQKKPQPQPNTSPFTGGARPQSQSVFGGGATVTKPQSQSLFDVGAVFRNPQSQPVFRSSATPRQRKRSHIETDTSPFTQTPAAGQEASVPSRSDATQNAASASSPVVALQSAPSLFAAPQQSSSGLFGSALTIPASSSGGLSAAGSVPSLLGASQPQQNSSSTPEPCSSTTPASSSGGLPAAGSVPSLLGASQPQQKSSRTPEPCSSNGAAARTPASGLDASTPSGSGLFGSAFNGFDEMGNEIIPVICIVIVATILVAFGCVFAAVVAAVFAVLVATVFVVAFSVIACVVVSAFASTVVTLVATAAVATVSVVASTCIAIAVIVSVKNRSRSRTSIIDESCKVQ